jgi:hypothetical protein
MVATVLLHRRAPRQRRTHHEIKTLPKNLQPRSNSTPAAREELNDFVVWLRISNIE